MIRFVYPNVKQEKFTGCGRYVVLPPGQTPDQGVRSAEPNSPNIGKVSMSAAMLAQVSTDSKCAVYEIKDHDQLYQGASLDLAYLLALVNCSREVTLNSKKESRDIWCTGSIDIIDGKRPFLDPVYPKEFNIKLREFLSESNDDSVFIVPAANFHPNHEIICKENNARTLSVKEIQSLTNASQELFKKKTLIKVQGDELSSLIDVFFQKPDATDSSLRHRRSLLLAAGVIGLVAFVSVLISLLHSERDKKPSSFIMNTPEIHGIRVPPLNSEIQSTLQLAYNAKLQEVAPSAAMVVMVKPGSSPSEHWRPLHDGETLSSADNYRIMFCPETTAYFYVIQIDSRGKLDWLFPTNSATAFSVGKNPAPAGLWTAVPGENTGFHLDENLGLEHLYVIATQSRWYELENALEKACKARAGTAPIQTAFNLKTRGAGGIRMVGSSPVKNAASEPKNVRRLLTGKDGILVYEKWFQHVTPVLQGNDKLRFYN